VRPTSATAHLHAANRRTEIKFSSGTPSAYTKSAGALTCQCCTTCTALAVGFDTMQAPTHKCNAVYSRKGIRTQHSRQWAGAMALLSLAVNPGPLMNLNV
jgi:hypothetical protein